MRDHRARARVTAVATTLTPMQAVIITDRSFARRERQMLARLEVGLADDGVRVIHAAPQATIDDPAVQVAGIYSTVVGFQDRGLPLTLASRARELLDAVKSASDSRRIDLVHAFGLDCWPIARRLAAEAGAGLLLELWCPMLVDFAADLPLGRPGSPDFITSEQSIATMLQSRSRAAKVHIAPWWVLAPPAPRPPFPGDRPLAVAILCDTGQPRVVLPAIRGLLEATAGKPEVMIMACVDPGPRRHESALWAAARRLNLLDRFSISPNMESRREPILEMDLLMLPEAHGLQRTIVLEAMAAGMPVIASADANHRVLIEGQTALLAPSGTHQAWTEVTRRVVGEPASSPSLAQSAHEWVRANRPAARHVSGVLNAYRAVASALAPA